MIGFDDNQSAAFQNPALTTVRQPLRGMGLRGMGKIAAETLVRRIARNDSVASTFTIQPELVVRGTTSSDPRH